MRVIDIHTAREIIANLKINKNLQRRLSMSSIASMPETEWGCREMVTLPTKDGTAGVLFIESHDALYVTPYEIGPVSSSSTGSAKPIICDFCKTWQPGSRAGSILFRTKHRSLNSLGYLCCFDLRCSLHARSMTESANTSRAQLREDITDERRVQRLDDKMHQLIKKLDLNPVIRWGQ